MEFELLGNSLDLSEGRKNLMAVQLDYEKIAAEAQGEFGPLFSNIVRAAENSGSMMEYMQMQHKRNEFMDRFIRGYVSKTRAYLTKYNVYSVTDENILKGVFGYPPVSSLQMKFDDAVGDFLNQCYFHGNSDVGMKGVFVSKERELRSTLTKDIMGLCGYVQRYLHENAVIEIEFISEEDANKAFALYTNLLEGHIPADEKNGAAIDMITLDPRKKEYYELVFSQFPDARKEICDVADYLGISLNEVVMREMDARFDFESITCEEDAKRMKEELSEMLSLYHASYANKTAALDRILRDFDIRARSYDGVVYETRELRAKAEEDDVMLHGLHGNVGILNKNECRELMSRIAGMDCTEDVKPKHLSLLFGRISEIDREHLEGMLGNVSGMTEIECNGVIRDIETYDAPDQLKNAYIARVRSRIAAIWEKEDFERLSRLYMGTRVGDEADIANNSAIAARMGRSNTKMLFIEAMHGLTPENIEKAAKYGYAKEKGGSGGIFGKSRGEIYDMLTLNDRVMHPVLRQAIDAIRVAKEPVPISAPAAQAVFCVKCGNRLTPADRFCPNCGAKQY